MKRIIILILNILIPIILFFLFGMLYYGIYGSGGEYDESKNYLFEIFYFFIGVIHVIILYKKWDILKLQKIIFSSIILLTYFYLAFIFGK